MNDAQLAELSDEKLIAYAVRARAAARLDCAERAIQVIAFRHEKRVRSFVSLRLQSKGDVVCDEVADITLSQAIAGAASFEGGTVKEFRRWIFVIARRRIADQLDSERRKKERDYGEVPLEEDWGEGPKLRADLPGGDPIAAFDRGSVFNQALGGLKKDSHRLVVLLDIHGIPHKQIAAEVNRQFGDTLTDPMTENNVTKILSRFHKRLDDLLEEADDPAPPPDDDD